MALHSNNIEQTNGIGIIHMNKIDDALRKNTMQPYMESMCVCVGGETIDIMGRGVCVGGLGDAG